MKTVHGGIMIKFIIGMIVCYILVSVFGLDVFSNMWDQMMNIFNSVKEMNDQDIDQ